MTLDHCLEVGLCTHAAALTSPLNSLDLPGGLLQCIALADWLAYVGMLSACVQHVEKPHAPKAQKTQQALQPLDRLFKQNPKDHVSGCGCQVCVANTALISALLEEKSKGEACWPSL